MLLPNASVAEFMANGPVNDDGHPDERRVPGEEQTLFIYYDSAEAWKAFVGVSAIIVLPHFTVSTFSFTFFPVPATLTNRICLSMLTSFTTLRVSRLFTYLYEFFTASWQRQILTLAVCE